MGSIDVQAILASHFLFGACDPVLLARAAEGCMAVNFAPEQVVDPFPGTSAPFLCILLSGTAAVYTPGEDSDCLLRVLSAGDTFGVATLFAGESAVTRVVALKSVSALCMDEATVRRLLAEDPALAMRYIAFLSDRIRFLNRRIACLGAGSATRRLAAWLDATAPEHASCLTIPLPMHRLADTLGVGRASLYRVFDRLSDDGYIRREGKDVLFLDRAGMCRAYGLL